MKRIYLFIALVMMAGLSVSCKKNNNGNKQTRLAPAPMEEVESAKAELAENVLTSLDDLAQSYVNEFGETDITSLFSSCLTEEEKSVPPDFLLDPARTNELITHSQKVAALAFLEVERNVRSAYEMPVKEADEAIAHLVADLNHPITVDENKNLTVSDKTRKIYEQCKERGELLYFWQFAFALQTEMKYLAACCPEPFFRNLSEKEYKAFCSRYDAAKQAVVLLSGYDPEMKAVYDTYKAYGSFEETEAALEANESLEAGKAFYSAHKEDYAARRANMLK